MTSAEAAIRIEDSSDDESVDNDFVVNIDLTETSYVDEEDEEESGDESGEENVETTHVEDELKRRHEGDAYSYYHHGDSTAYRRPQKPEHLCENKCLGCLYWKWCTKKIIRFEAQICSCAECEASVQRVNISRICVRSLCIEAIADKRLLRECIKQWEILYKKHRPNMFESNIDCYYKTVDEEGFVSFTKAKIIGSVDIEVLEEEGMMTEHQYTIQLSDEAKTVIKFVPHEQVELMVSKRIFRHIEKLRAKRRCLRSHSDTIVSVVPHTRAKPKIFSTSMSRLNLYSNVYARFPRNKEYYWGRIIRIRPDMVYMDVLMSSYDVQFFDNDVGANIPRKEISLESEVDQTIDPKPFFEFDQPVNRWFTSVYAERCGVCKTCKRFANRKSTGRQCRCRGCTFPVDQRKCIHDLCDKTAAEHRFQLPDSFPNCWSFFLTRNTQHAEKKMPIVVDAMGDEIMRGSLVNKLLMCGYTSVQVRECFKHLFHDECGLPEKAKLHGYIGKRWQQECLNANGEKVLIAGEIFDSRINWDNGMERMMFLLRMDDRDKRGRRKEYHDLSLEDAKRGIACATHHNILKSGKTTQGWFAPNDYKRNTRPGTVTFSWNGFDFSLSSEKSKIEKAGKGLFLLVSTTRPVKAFVLKKDQLLDLGVYGPVSEDDYTNQTTHSLKNFLYDHLPAVYVFASKKDNYVIDPMDDATCEMNPLAHQSLLVYANETDGKALRQSIAIAYDAFGAVHYLLSGPLRIPVDEKKELYVDYTEAYEQNRVRFGYPRVSGEELDNLRKDNENFESDFIEEVETVFSMNSLLLGLELVRIREASAAENSVFFCQRALVLVMIINKRLKEQFMVCCNEIEQSNKLLGWILSQVEHLKVDLKKIVVGFPLLANKICSYSQRENIEQMTTHQIKSLILDRGPRKRPASRMEGTAL